MPDNCTVLVVDDHADSRELTAEYLTLNGCAVVCAADGVEAIQQASLAKPHVVLMDLTLPGPIDGWEAIRRLKADPETRAAEVIVVTGWSDDAAHARALRAGAQGVLLKPVDQAQLVGGSRQLCGPASSPPPP
jgi:CheY-like chemotaxis protein